MFADTRPGNPDGVPGFAANRRGSAEEVARGGDVILAPFDTTAVDEDEYSGKVGGCVKTSARQPRVFALRTCLRRVCSLVVLLHGTRILSLDYSSELLQQCA